MNDDNNKSVSVVQHNYLIEARYRLSLQELKLFLVIVSKISVSDTIEDFRKGYRIYINDFVSGVISGKESNRYTEARRITRKLRSRVIEMEKNYGHYITGFIETAKHYRSKGYVDITLDGKLGEYLLDLRRNFTRYDIDCILHCKSVYSIRIYQLMKQYRGIGWRDLEYDELRKILDIDKGLYKRFFDFKKRILDTACKEIKKFTDIEVEYKVNKRGRNIVSIGFRITDKSQRALEFTGTAEKDSNNIIEIRRAEDKQVHNLLDGLDTKVMDEVLSEFADTIKGNKLLMKRYLKNGLEDGVIKKRFEAYILKRGADNV